MTNARYTEIRLSVQKPEASLNFTVDDIHKIRSWHYEITKDLSAEERAAYYKKGVESSFEFLKAHGLPQPKIWNPQKNGQVNE
jgi:hypothetical protein